MLKGSPASDGSLRPKARARAGKDPTPAARTAPRYCSIKAGGKRSKPALTAVCVVKRFPARVAASATANGFPILLHESAGTFQQGEGRMPFIEMADFRLDAEGIEQSPSAQPEHDLLFQAQFCARHRRARPVISRRIGAFAASFESSRYSLRRPTWTCQVRSQTGEPGNSELQAEPFAVRLIHRGDRELSWIIGRDTALAGPRSDRSLGENTRAGRAIQYRPLERRDRWRPLVDLPPRCQARPNRSGALRSA